MSVTITGKYLGNKKMLLTHGPSGAELITEPPTDNQGEGKSFSPTDLVGAALAACTTTIISIVAERYKIDIDGMRMEIEKHMSESPRRIVRLPVKIWLPAHLTEVQRVKLENAARSCPVHHSLHPNIDAPVEFIYE